MNLHKNLIEVINEELMPRFRTKIEDLLPKIPAKASGEQIAAMLRNNGVSDHEIKWTKLETLLKQPKVTKDEIVDHLANHGLPFYTKEQPKQYQNWALKGGKNYGEKTFHMDPAERDIKLDWEKDNAPDTSGGEIESWETREDGRYFTDNTYSTVWVLDENNQIRVIGRSRNHDKESSSMFKKVFVEVIKDKSEIPATVEKAKKACQDYVNKVSGEQNIDRKDYQSSHWQEGTNPLFHVRHQEFKDADGKDLWLIEEIQSDLHQEGRKKGYKGDFKAEIKHEFPGDEFPFRVYMGNEKISAHATEDEAKASAAEIEPKWNANNGVPNAPMKKTWEEMAFKWALHQAVQAGADRIGWITGDIAADRFDIAKQTDHIRLIYVGKKYQTANYKMKLIAYKDGYDVLSKDLNDEHEIEGVIGKEAAKKLLDQPIQDNERDLKGEALKIGGEGMKAAYDQRIVSIAKKIAKITGAMVGKVALPEASKHVDADDDAEGIKEITQDKLDRLREYLSGGNDWGWGSLDEPQTDDEGLIEKHQKKEEKWLEDESKWQDCYMNASKALPAKVEDLGSSLIEVADLLEEASQIEGEWGDDPSSMDINSRIKDILGWSSVGSNQVADALRSYEEWKDKGMEGQKGQEVWYMDLNEKTKAMVAGGMRATFESVKPKHQKPWWIV